MTSSPARRVPSHVILAILTLVVFLNYLDRYVLAILVEPIRADLKLSDTQIGLLTGAGFALLYSVMAIPIARLAETHNRMKILAVSAFVWSLATLTCGFAVGFASLFLARIIVGCGEAGGVPSSLAMIADLAEPRRRATAMAIFGMGGSAGAAMAPLLGSWLEAHLGWRHSFLVIGALGIPVAIGLLFLREPVRGAADGHIMRSAPMPFFATLGRLLSRPSFALLMPALIAMALAEYSLLLWVPALFQRSFGLSSTALGGYMTAFQGAPFFLGTLLGGVICDRLSRRDLRWIVWVPLAGALLAIPGIIGILVATSATPALILLILPSLVSGLYIGPCYALIQNLSAPTSRATAAAVLALVVNLIGAGFGPLMLGTFSDFLQQSLGADSLRYAFSILIPLYLIAAAAFAAMGRHLAPDIADVSCEIAGSPLPSH